MKKFFYIIVLLSFYSVANAQTAEQQQYFIIQAFPGYMVGYVLENATQVAVTERYARKHKQLYQYTDLKESGYQGTVRVGDTLVVFKGTPFYSKGQNLFMVPLDEQRTAKRAKAPKQPKTPEQRAQDQQLILTGVNLGTNILGAVLNKRNFNYGSPVGGLVTIGQ